MLDSVGDGNRSIRQRFRDRRERARFERYLRRLVLRDSRQVLVELGRWAGRGSVVSPEMCRFGMWAALASGEFASARDYATRRMENVRGCHESVVVYLRSSWALGEFQAGLEFGQGWLRANRWTPGARGPVLLELSRLLIAGGDERRALALALRALLAAPVSFSGWSHALSCLARRYSPESKRLWRVLTLPEFRRLRRLVKLAEAAEQPLLMLRYADLMVELRSTCPAAIGAKLRALRLLGRHAEGEAFSTPERRASYNAECWNLLGCIQSDQRKLSAALESFTAARAKDADHLDAYLNHLWIMGQLGQYDAAIQEGRIGRIRYGSVPRYWREMAALYNGAGQVDEELECYDKLISLKPDDEVAAGDYTATLARHGKGARAIVWGERWLKQHGPSAYVLNRLGHAYLDTGDSEKAYSSYTRAGELEPRDPVIQGNRLLALGELKQAERALEVLGSHGEDFGSDSAYYLRRKGVTLYHCGQLPEALQALEVSLDLDSHQEEVASYKLAILEELDRKNDARAFIASWSNDHKMSGRLWNNWANLLAEHREHERALELYRKAVEDRPASVHVGNLVYACNRCDRFDEAVEVATDWLSKNKEDDAVRRALADVYFAREKAADALAEYERVLESSPEDVVAFERSFSCLRLLGRGDEVLELALPLVADLEQASPYILTELGLVQEQKGHFELAEHYYELALQVEPDRESTVWFRLLMLRYHSPADGDEFAEEWVAANPGASARVLNQWGIIKDILGDAEAALDLFRRAVAKESEEPSFVGNLVDHLRRMGRHQEAFDLGSNFLSAHKGNAHLHRAMGNAWLDQERYEEALKAYRHALNLEPADPSYAGNVLHALFELKEYVEVITTADQWRAVEGHQPGGYFMRWVGLSYHRLNQVDKALALLQTVPPSDPDYPAVVSDIAFILSWQGFHSQALARLQLLDEQILGTSALCQCEMERAYQGLGMHREALECARRTVEIEPASVHYATSYLTCLRTLGEEEEADEFAERWLAENHPAPQVITFRARFAFDGGHYAEAEQLARSAYDLDGSYEPAVRYIVKSLIRQERRAEAKAFMSDWLRKHEATEALQELLRELDSGTADEGQDPHPSR